MEAPIHYTNIVTRNGRDYVYARECFLPRLLEYPHMKVVGKIKGALLVLELEGTGGILTSGPPTFPCRESEESTFCFPSKPGKHPALDSCGPTSNDISPEPSTQLENTTYLDPSCIADKEQLWLAVKSFIETHVSPVDKVLADSELEGFKYMLHTNEKDAPLFHQDETTGKIFTDTIVEKTKEEKLAKIPFEDMTYKLKIVTRTEHFAPGTAEFWFLREDFETLLDLPRQTIYWGKTPTVEFGTGNVKNWGGTGANPLDLKKNRVFVNLKKVGGVWKHGNGSLFEDQAMGVFTEDPKEKALLFAYARARHPLEEIDDDADDAKTEPYDSMDEETDKPDDLNMPGLPTVVVQSEETNAKMAAEPEIAEATPMALGHAATGTNMPLFGEMPFYVQREKLHDMERHKRQMQEARSPSIFEIQDAMNDESKKSVGANDADQNAQRTKRFKQEKELEEVLDNSAAAIMHEELKPIGRANADSVEECENKLPL